MNFTITIVALLCLVALIALIKSGKWPSKLGVGGFRDWVENPDYKRAAEEYFARREALTVPDNISRDEIQLLVDRLFEQDDNDFNLEKLKLIGSKATPLLINALNSDEAFEQTFSAGRHATAPKSPFERICDLLSETAPASAAEPLKRYALHLDSSFRKHAAITLGNIGTDECTEAIVRLLTDSDCYVRSFALMGIDRGLTGKRCTEGFLRSVFPVLESLLDSVDCPIRKGLPDLLLAIDQERAIPILLSDEHLNPDSKAFLAIIEAFNEADIPVPRPRLLALIDELRSPSGNELRDRELAAVLAAYATNPDSNTESVLSEFRNSENGNIASAAAKGLAKLYGVIDPTSFVFELYESNGWDAMSAEQQRYYAVLIYDGEVNNGGHSQYFVNSSGDLYPAAMDGLRAVRAIQRFDILASALQLFGSDGPSTDNATRHQQLAAFSKSQHSELNALDTQYYECSENIAALLFSYATDNKEHFSEQR